MGAGEMDGGRGGIGGGSKDSGEESTLITSGWKHHNKNINLGHKKSIRYSCNTTDKTFLSVVLNNV